MYLSLIFILHLPRFVIPVYSSTISRKISYFRADKGISFHKGVFLTFLEVFWDIFDEILAFEPRSTEESVLVSVGTIAQDCSDSLSGPENLGHFVGCDDVEGGGCADVETFLV